MKVPAKQRLSSASLAFSSKKDYPSLNRSAQLEPEDTLEETFQKETKHFDSPNKPSKNLIDLNT